MLLSARILYASSPRTVFSLFHDALITPITIFLLRKVLF